MPAPALALVGLRDGLGPHDEGLMLQWGHRIADGQWPYRDFWCNYLPGQPLLQAVLGDSLLVWRLVRAATGAIAAVLAYLLVRGEVGRDLPEGSTDRDPLRRWWALGAWAGVAAAMAWPLVPGPNASAVALAFGAVLLGRRSPAWGGALAGARALFRPEVGAAAALAVAWEARAAPLPEHPARRARPATVLAAALATFAGGLLPFLVAAPGDLLAQTFGFADEQDLQRLPFPLAPHTTDPNKLLERLFPAILVAGCLTWLALAWRARRGWPWLPLLLAGLAYLFARTDEFHLVPLAAILAAALAERARAPAAIVLALIVLHGLDRQVTKVRDDTAWVEVRDGVRTDAADARNLRLLRATVDALSEPGDPILVAPPRFDRVRVGDPLLYRLLDRDNPTRYDVMQPGVVTTAKVQREMLRDLRGTDLMVRWLDPRATALEDNASARSSGVTLLDDAIARDFRRVARFGPYLLLQRSRRANASAAASSTAAT
ncbi:MAG: hypothetical protein HZB46_01245 [Solirubrobacterales bacterium]|nr:hypothetical protein [Solirubrobacterales bacterium]